MARIAQIVSTYPPYRGGMGNVASAFTDGLRERGHDVQVFTPTYGSVDGSPNFVHRQRGVISFGNASWLPGLGKLMGNLDIVHLHYPFFGGAESVARAMAKRRQGQRFIVTYHMDTVGSGLKSFVFGGYKRLIMPAILRQADCVTVSSLDYARNSALQPFISSLRVEELPFGVSDHFTALKRSGLNSDGHLALLFVGGLDKAHYFKGLAVLLEAIAQARQAGVPVILTVVGDGDLRSNFETQAQALGIQKLVRFLGNVDQQHLVQAYQQADVTVLPSVDQSEAFGLVLVESMACGTPVMASDLPGVRTVFEEGKSGWAVPAGDVEAWQQALQQAWQQRDQLSVMRLAASARVHELYRWPAIIDRLEQIYQH